MRINRNLQRERQLINKKQLAFERELRIYLEDYRNQIYS